MQEQQDYADITPFTRAKPYRALTLSTPSMTCLERCCGVVAALFPLWLPNSIDGRVQRSLQCLQVVSRLWSLRVRKSSKSNRVKLAIRTSFHLY
jgi:hypothetical protein